MLQMTNELLGNPSLAVVAAPALHCQYSRHCSSAWVSCEVRKDHYQWGFSR